MKKLINSADTVVTDALVGMAAAHPGALRVDVDQRVVYRAIPKDAGRVAIVSGGGSGHEPLHSGFVGSGMLDAACAGEVFTSPVPDQIVSATVAVDRGAGVLHVVKNYTGDVMNFEMAAELAASSGIRIATVVVADDVAVEDSLYTAGRRGVGATLVVEKVAGAAAEEGRSLEQVAALAERVAQGGRSMGVALTSCTVPANGKPSFDLPDDEMEIGIGIHGEPGRSREKATGAREVARRLVEPIAADLPSADGDVIVLLNGMGATPLLELYIMYGQVVGLLREAGIAVARSLVGNYVTSLDMAGCSLTLVRADEEILRLWDAPVAADDLRAWVRRCGDLVAEQARALTELDAAIGDADHGANLKRGMAAAVEALAASADTPDAVLRTLAMTLISRVGGASGVLYGTFFLSMADATRGRDSLDLRTLTDAIGAGVSGIARRGRAEAGEKTMLDAWYPALDALRASTDLVPALEKAAAAADAGRTATGPMLATKGRASYLGERSVGHIDPGAASTALLLRALAEVMGGRAS